MLKPSSMAKDFVWFQSSPGQKAGCNQPVGGVVAGREIVSILTRPEGRMQSSVSLASESDWPVSILTRPEGRMQCGATGAAKLRYSSFNPHPARRPDAIFPAPP